MNRAALVLAAAVAIGVFVRQQRCGRTEAPMGGFVAPGFEKVRDVFRHHVQSGLEKGASFVVYHRGQLVVDLWGGIANYATAEAWNSEHIQPYYSCTKGIAALLVAMFVDRGMLSYEAKVSDYWPEFAQNGKENITVGQLMSHQAGLALISEPFEMYKIMADIDHVGRLFERQTPNWPPGQRSGYHILTFGMLVEYLLYRADVPKHRRIDRLFREEVAEPFGVDIHIGLPAHLYHRAVMIDLSEWGSLKSILYNLHMLPAVIKRHLLPSDEDVLAERAMKTPADILQANPPSSNLQPQRLALPLASSHGFGTPKALALLWAIVANDGLALNHAADASCSQGDSSAPCDGGKRLLSKATLARLGEVVASGPDLVLYGLRILRGFGTVLQQRTGRQNQTYHLIGHNGMGGQMAYADVEERLAFVYVTNHLRMTQDYMGNPRFQPLYDVMYDAVLRMS